MWRSQSNLIADRNRTNRLRGWASTRQSNPSNDNKRNCADSRNRTTNGGKSSRVSRNVRILLPSRFTFIGVGLAVLPPSVALLEEFSSFLWRLWCTRVSTIDISLCSVCQLSSSVDCFGSAQDFYKSSDSIFGCGPTSFSAGISFPGSVKGTYLIVWQKHGVAEFLIIFWKHLSGTQKY